MPIYTVACKTCGEYEIEKPMHAPLPHCECGGVLRRVYKAMPAIQYACAGFHMTDYVRQENLFGKERAEKVRKQNAEAAERARQGRLSPYEKALEGIS